MQDVPADISLVAKSRQQGELVVRIMNPD